MILKEFLATYSSSEARLRKLMSIRYGFKPYCAVCKRRRSFKKMKNRPVYQCGGGHQVSPLAGTVFEKTTTPLQYWFYAMWLMTATRGGISAKQLQRELGVTYKTAWRMAKQIRILMGKRDGRLLQGIVEVDESFFGGKGTNRKYVPHFNEKPKDIIMGMVEREGQVVMKKIETTGKIALWEQLEKHVDTKATVMTDQLAGYTNIHRMGYEHHSVDHGKTYVVGKTHTNNIEGL
jgi:ISXO2-like transposase domain